MTSPRRRGFSLVEISIATLVGAVLLACVMNLLVSGSKLMTSGMNAARGPEAAVLLMDRLEEDLVQVLQIPGDPRPPVQIEKGKTISFYVPGADGALTSPQTVVGSPQWWRLEDSRAYPGNFHPVRGEETLAGILVQDWEFTLWAPDLDADVVGWYLTVRVTFPPASRFGRPYVYSRAIYLPQPSSNFLHFPDHGHEVNAGTVKLLPPPRTNFVSFSKIRAPGADQQLKAGEDTTGAIDLESLEDLGSFLGTDTESEG